MFKKIAALAALTLAVVGTLASTGAEASTYRNHGYNHNFRHGHFVNFKHNTYGHNYGHRSYDNHFYGHNFHGYGFKHHQPSFRWSHLGFKRNWH